MLYENGLDVGISGGDREKRADAVIGGTSTRPLGVVRGLEWELEGR